MQLSRLVRAVSQTLLLFEHSRTGKRNIFVILRLSVSQVESRLLLARMAFCTVKRTAFPSGTVMILSGLTPSLAGRTRGKQVTVAALLAAACHILRLQWSISGAERHQSTRQDQSSPRLAPTFPTTCSLAPSLVTAYGQLDNSTRKGCNLWPPGWRLGF